MGGIDFIQTIKAYPEDQLTNGVKIVYAVDISPSSFVGTRMELLSNLYQMYRYDKFHIHFKPQIPDVINGVFITYIDTDPEDRQEIFSKEELLRLANAHQFAEQVSANKKWEVKLPILKQDDMFYTGNAGDKRFRKQGRLYIIQIGSITNFEGKKITKPLDLGILSARWSCTFGNPQMQSLNRVFDGASQKNILRVFSNLAKYIPFSATFPATQVVAGSRYRHRLLPLSDFYFPSTGDYQVIVIPRSSTVPNSLKGVHATAAPYSDSNYSKSIQNRVYDDNPGTTSDKVSNLDKYLNQAFGLIKGGITFAKTVYDVVSLVSTFFVANLDTAVTIPTTDIMTHVDETEDSRMPAYGATVVHWDGKNIPVIEMYAEFEDNTHAVDVSGSDFTLNFELLLFKLDLEKNGEAIDTSLPSLNFNYIS